MLHIDLTTARRFIMGKQGLWPGRRWTAATDTTTTDTSATDTAATDTATTDTTAAMLAMDYVQLDPLQMVARSQDIALHARLVGYSPEGWQQPTYQDRKFFDWGAWLAVRPMQDLPHVRRVMWWESHNDQQLIRFAHEHAEAIVEMRHLLKDGQTLSNRDFVASERKKTTSYRGRKDSALALYWLWRTGEVMTHHRERFERVYALSEAVAPPELLTMSEPEDADQFLVLKDISFGGLSRLQRTADAYFRGVPFDRIVSIKQNLLMQGAIVEVRVEGWKQVHYTLAKDVQTLSDLSAGRLLPEWTSLGPSTNEEVTILAPLDPVIARGRAKPLFNFEYTWDVYKPAEKRPYGYYTMPILWGDTLVARFDSKLDRAQNTLYILGLWLENPALANNPDFAQALGSGFSRFTQFLGAATIDARALDTRLLRSSIESSVNKPS